MVIWMHFVGKRGAFLRQKVCLLPFQKKAVPLHRISKISMWTSEQICSTVVLCPAKYVAACTETNFLASDESKVITLRSRGRAQFNRSEKNTDGGKLQEEDITFTFEDNSITAALRKSKFKYWVARVYTIEGYTRMIGTLRYPAVMELEGTDTNDTLTLKTKQEV